ncbi:unnamed protein product, partial [Urochloa humidicola]
SQIRRIWCQSHGLNLPAAFRFTRSVGAAGSIWRGRDPDLEPGGGGAAIARGMTEGWGRIPFSSAAVLGGRKSATAVDAGAAWNDLRMLLVVVSATKHSRRTPPRPPHMEPWTQPERRLMEQLRVLLVMARSCTNARCSCSVFESTEATMALL